MAAQWRDTARPVRFFCFDARVCLCIGVWAFHMCIETFLVACCGIFVFGLLSLCGCDSLGFAIKRVIGLNRLIEPQYWNNRRVLW
ncbi:MAG: IcmT/TraK family protein [Desulfovibrio sp.]|nr:IcmT/TraK family protein [Desulfovibrio sp.]